MSAIKLSNIHLSYGQMVRVVYTVDRGTQPTNSGLAIVVDDLITPPVLLRNYNRNTGEVEFERTAGSLEKMLFKEILPA